MRTLSEARHEQRLTDPRSYWEVTGVLLGIFLCFYSAYEKS
jgi:hypothetical protein